MKKFRLTPVALVFLISACGSGGSRNSTASVTADNATSTTTVHVSPTPQPPSVIHLTGNVVADVTVERSHIICGWDGSADRIGATFEVAGTWYWFRVGTAFQGPATEVFLQTFTASHDWRDDNAHGVSGYDSSMGVRLATSIPPVSLNDTPGNQATKSVGITGQIYCPPPGVPSTVAVKGAVSGQMHVDHVNCHVAAQSSADTIDGVGTLNGKSYIVTVNGDPKTGAVVAVTVNLVDAAAPGWTGDPARGSVFDGDKATTFSATALSEQYGMGTPPPHPTHVDVEGTLTCPS